MTGQKVTLEFLQSLSDTDKQEELQSAMAWCSTKELRSFCGRMGLRVRSKEYAAYHTKAGYSELLSQLLHAKCANKGLALGTETALIVVAPVERTRKTKNCNLRLLNVLFSDAMTPFLGGMNAEPTPTELAAGDVGGNNPFWAKFREEFVSSKPEHSRVAFQESCFTGFELSTPVPHSSTKLSEMWSELWGAYSSALTRFTHSTDPDVEFADCCLTRADIAYMRCWLNVKPDLLSDVCAKLPASIGLDGMSLTPSEAEGSTGVGSEHTTPSRKRSRSVMDRHAKGIESVADAAKKGATRALLMQSINHAVKTLALARELILGPEFEETVLCELQQCTRRLRRIQQEEVKTEAKEGHS